MANEAENVSDIYSGGNFLKSEDVPTGSKLTCKIKNITTKEFGKEDTQTKLVAELEDGKSFVINATNAKRLAGLFNTEKFKEWVGKTFILYRAETMFGGQEVACLRVQRQLE